MEKRHDPSTCRRILRDSKRGGNLRDLFDAARQLEAGPYRAEALCGLAARSEVTDDQRQELGEEIIDAMLEEERGWRLAECIGVISKSVSNWPEGDAQQELEEDLIGLTGGLPEGEARVVALRGITKRVPPHRLPDLLMLAIENRGQEAQAARPVLRSIAEDGDEAMLASICILLSSGAPDLSIHLLDTFHGHLTRARRMTEPSPLARALTLLDAADVETVRSLCSHVDSIEDVRLLADALQGEDERSIRCTTTLAGRADRAGDSEFARELLERAASGLEGLEPRLASRISKNIAKGFERMGDEKRAEAFKVQPAEIRPRTSPVQGDVNLSGHSIALVDTYSGSIGTPHLRALARAAGVAHGFGHDIVLVAWPVEDLAELCEHAQKESGTAGVNHLMELLENGRVSSVSIEDALAGAAGQPIATTHQPVGGSVDLASFESPLCLLMGLGRQGLPKQVLEGCSDHFELTGIGASLETAVAMGAIAQRLADL